MACIIQSDVLSYFFQIGVSINAAYNITSTSCISEVTESIKNCKSPTGGVLGAPDLTGVVVVGGISQYMRVACITIFLRIHYKPNIWKGINKINSNNSIILFSKKIIKLMSKETPHALYKLKGFYTKLSHSN